MDPTSGGGMVGNMQEMIFFGTDKSSDASAISTNINTYYSIYNNAFIPFPDNVAAIEASLDIYDLNAPQERAFNFIC